MQESRNDLNGGIAELEKVILTTDEEKAWTILVESTLPDTDEKIRVFLKSYCQSGEGD